MRTLLALSALVATSTALPPFLRQIFPPDHLLTWPSADNVADEDDLTIEHTTITVTLHPTTTSTIQLLSATATPSTTTTTTPTSASTPRVSCVPYSGSSPSPPPLAQDSPLRQNPSLFSSYALQLADSYCSSVASGTDFSHRILPLRIPVTPPSGSSACHAPPFNSDDDSTEDLTPLSSHTTPALLTFTFDGAITTSSVRRHRFEVQSHTVAECRVGCLDAMQTLIQECGFGGSQLGVVESAGFEEGEETGCGRWGIWVNWLSEAEMEMEMEKKGENLSQMEGVSGADEGEEEGEAWRAELRRR